MKKLTGFLILLATMPPAAAETEAEDIATVRKLLVDQQAAFNEGNLEAAVAPFAEDAKIISNGEPLVEGRETMVAGYEEMLAAFDVGYRLTSEEIVHGGDIIYERGTYTLDLLDKNTGEAVQQLSNNHIHIFKRQEDGSWKTWRMMYNDAAAETE